MVEHTLDGYHWRGVPKPFAHQVECTRFMVNNKRCFNFSDIGTGKSWSAIWAIDYLMKIGEVKNVLIVAPLSTLQIVWQRTFFHLDAGLDVQVLKGTAEQRRRILGRPITLSVNRVSIINPEGLSIIENEKALEDYDMILVDESAMFRNSKSGRYKSLAKICRKMKRVVMMTGSPCPEAPTDIWSTAKIICPERVPQFFGQFRDKTMRKINMFKWVALQDAQAKIAEMLKGYTIRFNRDECIDLPESQHHILEVEPSKDQTRMIREMRKAAVTMYEEDTVSAPNEAVVISKILQIASGAVKFQDGDNKGVIHTDASSKLKALEEILEASTQPVIVFAPYRAAIDGIADFFSGKIPYSVVTGDTHPNDRMQAFDALQSGLIRMLVAHPQAMAHGITLTNSNVVVWWCPVYSHEIYEQANGRVVRPGQIRSTYFIHLVCSAMEKRVLSKLESKATLQGTLLEYLQRRDD
jgi:SNF2 family DNA or RNA helicase